MQNALASIPNPLNVQHPPGAALQLHDSVELNKIAAWQSPQTATAHVWGLCFFLWVCFLAVGSVLAQAAPAGLCCTIREVHNGDLCHGLMPDGVTLPASPNKGWRLPVPSSGFITRPNAHRWEADQFSLRESYNNHSYSSLIFISGVKTFCFLCSLSVSK